MWWGMVCDGAAQALFQKRIKSGVQTNKHHNEDKTDSAKEQLGELPTHHPTAHHGIVGGEE